MIVAIDGPAASGKSTVARALATRLGARYLDTGAMYRSVAAEARRLAIAADDAPALAALAGGLDIAFVHEAGSALPARVFADGRDVTKELRTPEVDALVSVIAADPGVRHALVALQRALTVEGDWVVEGRDIGTVVFPDARVKVFLTASSDERARRRTRDMTGLGVQVAHEDVHAGLAQRDQHDSTRAASPLTPAADAVQLDTTGMDIAQVVESIAALAEAAR